MCLCLQWRVLNELEKLFSSSSVLSEKPAAAEREEPGNRQTDHHRTAEPAGAARHETGDAQTHLYEQDLTYPPETPFMSHYEYFNSRTKDSAEK